jgi:uncharacterized membrane protein
MMLIRLFILLAFAPTVAVIHLLPFVSRPDRFFGVAVPSGFRSGHEAKRLLARYELRALPWTIAALLCLSIAPLRTVPVFVAGAVAILLIAATLIFAKVRNRVVPFAVPSSSLRTAGLFSDKELLFVVQLAMQLIPLALLAGCAIYLKLNWNGIPARFVIHSDFDGTPNGWSSRTFLGVFGPLLIGAAIVLLITGISVATKLGSRKTSIPAVAKIIPVAVSWIISIVVSAAAISPLRMVSPTTILTFDLASFLILLVLIWISLRLGSRAASSAETTADANWRGDILYNNPEDPALFVEKRIGAGLTLNFGNRGSWIFLAVLALSVAGIVILAFAATR